MTTIIALIMGLTVACSGMSEVTTIANANTGTKTVVTTTMSQEYIEEYEYNMQTNEWELK